MHALNCRLDNMFCGCGHHGFDSQLGPTFICSSVGFLLCYGRREFLNTPECPSLGISKK